MRLVIQEDEYGCGVACMANLLEMPYQKALDLFADPQNASWRGFICKDMVYALKRAQNPCKYYYIKPRKRKRIYRDGTIVFIKRNKKYPVGHYLARKGRLWIDSWFNIPNLPRIAGVRKRLPGTPIYAIQVDE